MIESGAIPSSTWSYNTLIMLYLIFYNFFIFMIMLNFIIAIIVDAYMKLVASIADMEADQEFCSDVSSVMYVSIKSLVLRWPGHMQLIKALEENRKIVCSYATMRRLFPGWGRRILMGFLKHYERYDFMAITHEIQPSEQDETVRQTVAEVEERLAVMLGVPVPTVAERVMEGKRLSMIGDQERQARINKSERRGKKKETRRDPIIGRTLVVKNTDSYELSNGNEGRGGNMSNATTNGVDARAFQEMMDLVRQLHANSSPAAAMHIATEKNSLDTNARDAPLHTNAEGVQGESKVSGILGYEISSWLPEPSSAHAAPPPPARTPDITIESQPPLVQVASEDQFFDFLPPFGWPK